MIPFLIELTLRGSLVFALTWVCDRLFAGRMRARNRRAWWWMVALAFLIPMPLRLAVLPPLPPMAGPAGLLANDVLAAPHGFGFAVTPPVASALPIPFLKLFLWIWLAGVSVSLGLIVLQTVRTTRRWTGRRLCTDSRLLGLLEDCKADAGITAPIGLVLSEAAASPALLGWLRPRILLPAKLVSGLGDVQLRAVLLHELAHFRALDVPLHWLFTAARALHWFNPLVHLAARRWLHQRELAADETALGWLAPQQRPEYGEALLEALKHANSFSVPYGALALGESIENLKQRILMITRHATLPRLGLPAVLFTLALAALLVLQPVRADQTAGAKTAAIAASDAWIAEIDLGHYETSWKSASTLFQGKITSEKWQDALTRTRTPLGKNLGRKVVSAVLQTNPMTPEGEIKGEFAMIQYESSFENAKHMVETLSLAKEADGTWKAAGYLIKPN